MPDVEELQRKVPVHRAATEGMGMYRCTDAELTARLAAEPSSVTVANRFFKSLAGHCKGCGVACADSVCKSCGSIQKNVDCGPGIDEEAVGPVAKALSFQQACIAALIAKAMGGEGARGGKVVGHTKSGKPIYGPGHAHYQNAPSGFEPGDKLGQHMNSGPYEGYSEQDHQDAKTFHDAQAQRQRQQGGGGTDSQQAVDAHDAGAEYAQESGVVQHVTESAPIKNHPNMQKSLALQVLCAEVMAKAVIPLKKRKKDQDADEEPEGAEGDGDAEDQEE